VSRQTSYRHDEPQSPAAAAALEALVASRSRTFASYDGIPGDAQARAWEALCEARAQLAALTPPPAPVASAASAPQTSSVWIETHAGAVAAFAAYIADGTPPDAASYKVAARCQRSCVELAFGRAADAAAVALGYERLSQVPASAAPALLAALRADVEVPVSLPAKTSAALAARRAA
jgi:hypothetical protein